MAGNRTIARCTFDELEDGPNGPGFYYTLSDEEDNESDPIGPFGDAEAAETAFMAAMKVAAVEMVKQTLGLEELK
jgi:hypothetical protein